MNNNRKEMKEVASIRGLKINKEFKIKECKCNPFKFTKDGLFDCYGRCHNINIIKILTGEWSVVKKPKSPSVIGIEEKIRTLIKKGR